MSDVGYIPNHPTEAHIPISNWNLFFMQDEPFHWIVQMEATGPIYRIPKYHPATTPVPPEPPPQIGTLVTWSIPNDVAVQMGLPLPEDAPPGPQRMARMQRLEPEEPPQAPL